MGLFQRLLGMERRDDATIAQSADGFLQFFGLDVHTPGVVSLERALKVPAFSGAVTFLSAALANLPMHVFKKTRKGSEKDGGFLQVLVNEAPNSEWNSFAARRYFWSQVFTCGRGLFWIERSGAGTPLAFWPMAASRVTVELLSSGQRRYRFKDKVYPAADVIDVPFLLKEDQVTSYSPLGMGSHALSLSLAMGDYAHGFFDGGGVPPLVLVGPLPKNEDALRRAADEVQRAIKNARESGRPIFNIPAGHELKAVGIDPEKGQMTDGRRFQIEEIARIFNLPVVFLQDLSRGTFSNTEQQDLHLVKHLISGWAKALEDEMNLKLFGQSKRSRYVEHNLDGLQRGDFKSRMEGLARGVQSALITPNEGRDLDNRPALPGGDDLFMQGATVPINELPGGKNGDQNDG
ncbi:MAG: phage portal protein [Hyphomicrobiaceae bacterium]|nr:phage portal protein [Hyphomicrobiaceae bacterium]MCC0024621.1 phage portal protein [Hyphomicrobiaceae bacterium]